MTTEPSFHCYLNVKERCWEGVLETHTHQLDMRFDVREAERMFYHPPATIESAADALAAYKMHVSAFMEKRMRRQWADAEKIREAK